MRKAAYIIGAVLALVVVIWVIGFVLFSVGGETPGNGRGQVTTVEGVSGG
jgi:hypothetical protein